MFNYLFSHKTLNTLALSSILIGGIMLSGCAPNEDTNTFESQQVIENPYPFDKLRVPFVTPISGQNTFFGLEKTEACEMINNFFRKEGIKLEANYPYKKNGINVKLDGYDAKRKIGYVWIDDEAMGVGMMRGAWNYGYYYSQIKDEILTSDVSGQSDLDGAKSYIAQLIANEFNWDLAGSYAEKFNKIDDLMIKEHEKIVAYKEFYLDMFIQREQNNHKSGQFPIHKINENSNYQEKETAYIDWMLRGKLKKITKNIPQKETINKIIHSILDMEDEAKKEKRYDDLVSFLEPYNDRYEGAKPANDDLFVVDVEQMKKNINDYVNGLFDEKVALREAEQMDALPKIDGDFIALIGQRNYKLNYYGGYYIANEGLKQPNQITPEDGEELYKDAMEKVKQEKEDYMKVSETLETQVRQYIQWAKQQGGH